MDHQQAAALVPAADDPDVFVAGVENQIAGLGLIPLDRVAVGVLGVGASAVTDDVFPAAGVVEYPVGK